MVMEYKELEYLMENYLKTKGTVEIISDETEIHSSFMELNEIFDFTLKDKGYLDNFKVISFGDQAIYIYELTTIDKAKTTKYVAYTKDDKPKCLISHSNYEDNIVMYTEESYTVYQNDNNHIDARMILKTRIINNDITLDVNTINYQNGDYSKRDYSIFYSYGDIVGIETNNEKYFTKTNSYLGRLELVLKNMDTVSKKINNSIVDCFSDNKDNLKEYKIKRKDK